MFKAEGPTTKEEQADYPLREQDHSNQRTKHFIAHPTSRYAPFRPPFGKNCARQRKITGPRPSLAIDLGPRKPPTPPTIYVTRLRAVQQKGDPSRRLYWSSDISPKYLQALGLQQTPQAVAIRYMIVPFFYRKNQNGGWMEYLVDNKRKKLAPVFAFQLSELNTIEEIYWSTKLCK